MNRKGFTLIELLIAAAIFLVGAASFRSLLVNCLRAADSAERLKQAHCSLLSEYESISCASFADLPALNGRLFASGKGTVCVTQVLGDLRRIEVEIVWDKNRLPLKLATLRSAY